MLRKSIDHLRSPSCRSPSEGRLADESGLDARAGKEDRAGRAVVGAQRAVLFGPAAELAEGHQQHAIGQLRGGQVVEKRAQSAPASSPSSRAWVGNWTACES